MFPRLPRRLGLHACFGIPLISAGLVIGNAGCAASVDALGEEQEALANSSSFFTKEVPLAFEIRAPWNKINDPHRLPSTEGELSDGEIVSEGKHVPIKIGPRGRTSFSECSFRKLEAELVKPKDARGTAFAGLESFKIATHCELRNGFSLFGRQGDEKAVYRERLAYRWYQEMTTMALRTRPAVITYVSTDSPAQPPVTKQAFVLEDFKMFRKRIGGEKVEVADVDRAKLDQTTLATSYLFQLLIGNTDWTIGKMFRGGFMPERDGAGFEGDESTFNYKVFRTATTDVPLPYDFDIAKIVGGADDPWSGNPSFLAGRSDAVRTQVNDLVGFWRTLADPEARHAAIAKVVGARRSLESLTDAAIVDEDGKAIARARLATFFDALALIPTLKALDHGPLTLYEQKTKQTAFCTKVKGAHAIVPIGETPTRIGFRLADEAFDGSECEGLPPLDFITTDKTLWVDRGKVVTPTL